jgi:hypothetical protein
MQQGDHAIDVGPAQGVVELCNLNTNLLGPGGPLPATAGLSHVMSCNACNNIYFLFLLQAITCNCL